MQFAQAKPLVDDIHPPVQMVVNSYVKVEDIKLSKITPIIPEQFNSNDAKANHRLTFSAGPHSPKQRLRVFIEVSSECTGTTTFETTLDQAVKSSSPIVYNVKKGNFHTFAVSIQTDDYTGRWSNCQKVGSIDTVAAPNTSMSEWKNFLADLTQNLKLSGEDKLTLEASVLTKAWSWVHQIEVQYRASGTSMCGGKNSTYHVIKKTSSSIIEIPRQNSAPHGVCLNFIAKTGEARLVDLAVTFPNKYAGNATVPGLFLSSEIVAEKWQVTVKVNRIQFGPVEIFKREFQESEFKLIAKLSATEGQFIDQEVLRGRRYEYYATGTQMPSGAYEPAVVGVGVADPITNRGDVALVIEKELEPLLSKELKQYEADLIGDGWRPVRLRAPREVLVWWGQPLDQFSAQAQAEANQVNIKAMNTLKDELRAINSISKEQLQAVVLIGHLPTPFAGSSALDGHPENNGTWPSDLYYGNFKGNWDDSTAGITDTWNFYVRNLPNDGKFTNDILPGPLKLQVGRIDFFNLSFNKSNINGLTSNQMLQQELPLYKRYFAKNHAYRMGNIRPNVGSVVLKGAGFPADFDFRRDPGHLLGPMKRVEEKGVGLSENETFDRSRAVEILSTHGGSLFVSTESFGKTDRCMGMIKSSDFRNESAKPSGVFWNFTGSYMGILNSQNNLLRSAIGSPTDYPVQTGHWGLAATFGRGILYQRMSLGETLGDAHKQSVNLGHIISSDPANTSNNLRVRLEASNSIIGDPTLRLHHLRPVDSVTVNFNGRNHEICWQASPDKFPLDGFEVLSNTGAEKKWSRVRVVSKLFNGCVLTPAGQSGRQYLVRAIKKIGAGPASYWTTSTGIVAAVPK